VNIKPRPRIILPIIAIIVTQDISNLLYFRLLLT